MLSGNLLFDFRDVETGEGIFDFVTDSSECCVDKLRRTGGVRRIVETDVQSLAHFSDKGRTAFVGPAANRDDIICFFVCFV